MTHTKKVKDSRGTFHIEISLWIVKQSWEVDINGNSFRYDVHVDFTPKGKRKPLYGNYISMINEEDLHACKVEFWNKLKP